MKNITITNEEKTEISQEKKVLILGLNNSGKTSVILSLQGNRNLLSYYSLDPTPGLEVNNLQVEDINFMIWELGGQVNYREKYLEEFDRYTENVSRVIFIIDVQDIKRYDIALEYLKQIVQRFVIYENSPAISIFLHKFDPELEGKEEFSNENINKGLISKIKKLIPYDIKHQIFKTTIYTTFKRTEINF